MPEEGRGINARFRGREGGLTKALSAGEFPSVRVAAEGVEALVYRPDARRGFYRGPRFDGSGMIARVTWQGHTLFGPWRAPHDPCANDHAVGPAEEFGMGIFGMPGPLGFAEAAVGETFLKIGVGVQRKDRPGPYAFSHNYPIVDPGAWRVTQAAGRARFEHVAPAVRGYRYRYIKELRLERNGFTLAHRLANTGRREIRTCHYNHHFILLDGAPLGPAYRLELPFRPAVSKPARALVKTGAGWLEYARCLKAKEAWFSVLAAKPMPASRNWFRVVQRETGVAVRVVTEGVCKRFHLFATAKVICPEPFSVFRLKPGQAREWTIRYEFETA
jgi:hypothetical protein